MKKNRKGAGWGGAGDEEQCEGEACVAAGDNGKWAGERTGKTRGRASRAGEVRRGCRAFKGPGPRGRVWPGASEQRPKAAAAKPGTAMAGTRGTSCGNSDLANAAALVGRTRHSSTSCSRIRLRKELRMAVGLRQAAAPPIDSRGRYSETTAVGLFSEAL